MGYYVRILGRRLVNFTAEELQQSLTRSNVVVKVECEDMQNYDWDHVELLHPNDVPIVQIARHLVCSGTLAQAEIDEFHQQITSLRPASAVNWLQHYLPTVTVIYSFQILNGTRVNNGWHIFDVALNLIFNKAGGIIQIDNEGFSNEHGDFILTDFSGRASGKVNVAVLDEDEQWVSFTLNLRNKTHREAFFAGQVPKNMKPSTVT